MMARPRKPKEPIDQVKILLPKLSVQELKELQKNIEHTLSGKTLEVKGEEDAWFYLSLTGALKRELHCSFPGYVQFKSKNDRLYKKFETQFLLVDEWLKNCFPPGTKLSKLQRHRLYDFFTELAIEDLKSTSLPLSLTTLLTFFNNLPGLVDRKFPGYIKSGALIHLAVPIT
jgi:hypothetical protein